MTTSQAGLPAPAPTGPPSGGPDVLIVADDLSGAADSAVALAPRAATSVVLDPAAAWPAARVIAVDTDSRYLAGREAAARVAAAVGRAAPGTLVYKKIDSTLRGNIGPEIAACLAALAERRGGHRHLAVVTPAFPATGRTVLAGEVLVDGVPLSERNPGRRPLTRQLTEAGLRVAALPRSALRSPGPAAALRAAAAEGADAVVVDAVEEDDLARLALACTRAQPELPLLLAGSGGLAHHLPVPPDPAAGRPAPPPRHGGPALICVGSRSEIARAQCAALVEKLPARPVPVPAGPAGPAAAARQVRAALAAGQDVVVHPDPAEPVDPARAAEVAAGLAAAARPGLGLAGTLVVTGGETARAVLLAAGVPILTVAGEREPGVVLAHARDGLPVISKAGAFGDPETLLRVVRSLPPAVPRPA
ncbi:four-carbon acid sugar kinase family protein [Streptomyces hoynatensis]|uniref:four-carbon acid sugar kinase family protein n=1 Tax=Streptomyces hoynatensis TaxID=1141874 RepID=UPI00131A3EDE|nr:four-carbon acid sugar kinase family protein [Streptomyces hoynatensis]